MRSENGIMEMLAVDIGASSGKLLAGHLEAGRLVSRPVHRFENRLVRRHGHLCWDLEALFDQVVEGFARCPEAAVVSIDTWGVDFVLLDDRGEVVGDSVSYRDRRTEHVVCPVPCGELYRRTGIQHQNFNTVYQLLALRQEEPELLERAAHMLMVPDYLAWKLTGQMAQEYTNASTTGLLKAGEREWDWDLIDRLGLPRRIFLPISMAGARLGRLKPCYGTADFILAPSHDTASAVLASPIKEDSLFLSSGTWSLLGCVNAKCVTSQAAYEANVTNEGAWDGRTRLLKNIMGTWMLQCVRKEAGGDMSFDELQQAAQESRLVGMVDPMDIRFLSPASMTGEIALALQEQGLDRPRDAGECAAVVYHSLADAYHRAARGMEGLTGRSFKHIAIVGGGCKDSLLNRLTGAQCGMRVSTGPVEGSAVGNLLSSLMATGQLEADDIPSLLASSFDIEYIDQEK